MESYVTVPQNAKLRSKPLDKKSLERIIEAKLAQADWLLQPYKFGTRRLQAEDHQKMKNPAGDQMGQNLN